MYAFSKCVTNAYISLIFAKQNDCTIRARHDMGQ